MVDKWSVGDDKIVLVLCGANTGREGLISPFIPVGMCSFFKNGKCVLHRKKLKPYEGRAAHHKYYGDPKGREKSKQVATYIEDLWDTERGRDLVEMWIGKYYRG